MSSIAAEVSNSSPFEPSSSTSSTGSLDNSESSMSSSSVSNSAQLSDNSTASSGSMSISVNMSPEMQQATGNVPSGGTSGPTQVISAALANANFTAIPYLSHYLYPFQTDAFSSGVSDLVAASPASSSSSNSSYSNSSSTTDEPEAKKVKLSHYQYVNLIQNLKQSNSLSSINAQHMASAAVQLNYPSNSFFMVHKKLEERIGGILCCTVCLGVYFFGFLILSFWVLPEDAEKSKKTKLNVSFYVK